MPEASRFLQQRMKQHVTCAVVCEQQAQDRPRDSAASCTSSCRPAQTLNAKRRSAAPLRASLQQVSGPMSNAPPPPERATWPIKAGQDAAASHAAHLSRQCSTGHSVDAAAGEPSGGGRQLGRVRSAQQYVPQDELPQEGPALTAARAGLLERAARRLRWGPERVGLMSRLLGGAAAGSSNAGARDPGGAWAAARLLEGGVLPGGGGLRAGGSTTSIADSLGDEDLAEMMLGEAEAGTLVPGPAPYVVPSYGGGPGSGQHPGYSLEVGEPRTSSVESTTGIITMTSLGSAPLTHLASTVGGGDSVDMVLRSVDERASAPHLVSATTSAAHCVISRRGSTNAAGVQPPPLQGDMGAQRPISRQSGRTSRPHFFSGPLDPNDLPAAQPPAHPHTHQHAPLQPPTIATSRPSSRPTSGTYVRGSRPSATRISPTTGSPLQALSMTSSAQSGPFTRAASATFEALSPLHANVMATRQVSVGWASVDSGTGGLSAQNSWCSGTGAGGVSLTPRMTTSELQSWQELEDEEPGVEGGDGGGGDSLGRLSRLSGARMQGGGSVSGGRSALLPPEAAAAAGMLQAVSRTSVAEDMAAARRLLSRVRSMNLAAAMGGSPQAGSPQSLAASVASFASVRSGAGATRTRSQPTPSERAALRPGSVGPQRWAAPVTAVLNAEPTGALPAVAMPQRQAGLLPASAPVNHQASPSAPLLPRTGTAPGAGALSPRMLRAHGRPAVDTGVPAVMATAPLLGGSGALGAGTSRASGLGRRSSTDLQLRTRVLGPDPVQLQGGLAHVAAVCDAIKRGASGGMSTGGAEGVLDLASDDEGVEEGEEGQPLRARMHAGGAADRLLSSDHGLLHVSVADSAFSAATAGSARGSSANGASSSGGGVAGPRSKLRLKLEAVARGVKAVLSRSSSAAYRSPGSSGSQGGGLAGRCASGSAAGSELRRSVGVTHSGPSSGC